MTEPETIDLATIMRQRAKLIAALRIIADGLICDLDDPEQCAANLASDGRLDLDWCNPCEMRQTALEALGVVRT